MSKESKPVDLWRHVFASGHDRPNVVQGVRLLPRRARRPPRRIHRMPQAAAGRPTRPRELLAATYRCVLAGQADVAGLISAGELSPSTPAQPRSPRSQGDSRSTSSGTTATQRRPDNVPLRTSLLSSRSGIVTDCHNLRKLCAASLSPSGGECT